MDERDGPPPGPQPGDPPVEVRRSARRRRTVSAYQREDGTLVVLVPDRLSASEERAWVERMRGRLRRRRSAAASGDEALASRAAHLSRTYLGGRARPTSVVWSTRQQQRWGSCTPATGAIRISANVTGMPGWVVDYVLLHELAHLLEPGHGPAFWDLLSGYPRLERARGYLEGVAAAAHLQVTGACADEGDDAAPSGLTTPG